MSAKPGDRAASAGRSSPPPSGPIQDRAEFGVIRYANCWEDAEVLVRALGPVSGARCVSIASGGDNSFSLLARGAAHVLAADLSPAQLSLVELKAAAFEALGYEQLLAFLGVRDSEQRLSVYQELRARLSDDARSFWDVHHEAISHGVLHCGKFERYFQRFRRLVLPLIHRRATVRSLLKERSAEERETFYRTVWSNRRWRLLFRLFFGRWMMGRLGRDPEFFRFVEVPVSERILERTRYALTVLATHDNPYLSYILNGNWTGSLPDYLQPHNFETIRRSLANLQLFRGPVEEAAGTVPRGSIDAFNLSDVFEYVDLASYHAMLGRLVSAAAPGARLVYWNMLVPRHRPESMAALLEPAVDEAKRLQRIDRAFFYQDLVVEVVS